MSFLGSIGRLMAGSGLHEVLETVYASNAVNHMLSGKAVSRAVRGFMMVENALHILLMKESFRVSLPSAHETDTEADSSECDEIVEKACELYDRFVAGEETTESVEQSINLSEINTKLVATKEKLSKLRTSSLWLNFCRMTNILSKFLIAERTGNWDRHLSSIQEMLPFFVAAGHNLYANRPTDQHKEATRARKERDRVDTLAILEYLTERNPFTNDVSLRNIETGVEAEPDVNVDKAESTGNKTLELMKGQKILNYSFKKSNQSITLAAKPKSKSDSDFLNTDIDPQLMFQRLTTAANGLFENTSEVFQYELSSVPSSIFDCNRLPREACKSNLADAIWACGSDCIHEIDGEGFQYVLDGGSLLQRLPWTHGDSFGDITQMYVDHVIRKYKDPVIVFDSYPELPSIKDITHLRRTKGIISPNINFTSSMPCKTKKELFMSNSHNKQALINMLCDKLKDNDIRCKNATDDADLLIALTAVDCALSSEVVVIGEDTDREKKHSQVYMEDFLLKDLTFFAGENYIQSNNWKHFSSGKSLPPTSDSGKFHSLRVYHQCQKWMSEEVDMDPTDYGWEIKRGNFVQF
ncbi:Hypothetical predicted protein [Mytilus galloprovincialis]|uniref:Uncharacterized protein n=1 Tax=Mytilus galloprovincialis TaxID=29158 RepID=A0A8B6FHU6_MYTGA|nr:Hypothetical predicted protein [Mytilus galloprovincialis]